MDKKTIEAYKYEIALQTGWIRNMKKWLRYLVLASSFLLVLSLFAGRIHQLLGIISPILFALCVIAAVLTATAIRSGSQNVHRLIDQIDPSRSR